MAYLVEHPRCEICKVKSTCVLMDRRNEVAGHFCRLCGVKELKRLNKLEALRDG